MFQAEGDFTTTVWNVTYPRTLYSPGIYEVQVEISRWTVFYWTVGSSRLFFELSREFLIPIQN